MQRPIRAKVPALGGTDSCYFPASLLWEAHRDHRAKSLILLTCNPSPSGRQTLPAHQGGSRYDYFQRIYGHTSEGPIIVSLRVSLDDKRQLRQVANFGCLGPGSGWPQPCRDEQPLLRRVGQSRAIKVKMCSSQGTLTFNRELFFKIMTEYKLISA